MQAGRFLEASGSIWLEAFQLAEEEEITHLVGVDLGEVKHAFGFGQAFAKVATARSLGALRRCAGNEINLHRY